MCNVCKLPICPLGCPQADMEEERFFCPVCGCELGDETYIENKSKKVIGCQFCIGTISYNKLANFL